MSKAIRSSTRFALLCSVIGYKKNSRHILNQSDANPKPKVTWSRALSRASRLLITCIYYELLFVYVECVPCYFHLNCFGFGFTTQLKTALYVRLKYVLVHYGGS